MTDSIWIAPANLMQASAMALVFFLSLSVMRRHPRPYLGWWVTSWALHAVAGLTITAHLLGGGRIWMLLTALLAVAATLGLVACGRLMKGAPALARWSLPFGLGLVCLTLGLYVGGVPAFDVFLPAQASLALAHIAFAVTFWRAAGPGRGVGAWVVVLSTTLWGLHTLDFPLWMHLWPDHLALGFWLSAMFILGLGVGMVVHLLEETQAQGDALARELESANRDLRGTLEALKASRSEAAGSARAAAEQEALVRQILHDLRNATQAIGLIAEEIEVASGDNPGVQAALGALDRQVRFISNFLREKLAWIVDREALPRDGTRVPEALTAAVEAIGPAIAHKHQRLSVEACPPALLTISPVQFAQVLGNLLQNANQHCPTGAAIRVWSAVSDGWATFYVADDGPGIALASQGELGRTPRPDGTGVGLRNVHDLVTAAGGLFGVVSEPNRGACFHVTLPLASWGAHLPGDHGVLEPR